MTSAKSWILHIAPMRIVFWHIFVFQALVSGCHRERPGPEVGSSQLSGESPADQFFYQALGVSQIEWNQMVDELGRQPSADGVWKSLETPVCFSPQESSSGVSSLQAPSNQACPRVSGLKDADRRLIPPAARDYWREIGFNPSLMTVKQWQEATSSYGKPGNPAPLFSLVEPAQGVKEKTKVCVALVRLYVEFKQAQSEPDCLERVRKMSRLVLDENTYHTMVRGAAIIDVASRASQKFFPQKSFTREISRVNNITQCVVIPSHRLQQGFSQWGPDLGGPLWNYDL